MLMTEVRVNGMGKGYKGNIPGIHIAKGGMRNTSATIVKRKCKEYNEVPNTTEPNPKKSWLLHAALQFPFYFPKFCNKAAKKSIGEEKTNSNSALILGGENRFKQAIES